MQPGERFLGIPYALLARHSGSTADLVALQGQGAEAAKLGEQAIVPWVRVDGDDWRSEPAIEPLPLPSSEYGFSTGRRALPCTREQLIRQCTNAPETPAVWTPASEGLVRPESVGFLVDALKRDRLASSDAQTTTAGGLLAVLSGIAWLAGAEARSGWVVMCAVAAAWLAVAFYQSGQAEKHPAQAFAAAREQHRHAVWLERRPALLTWGLLWLIGGVMVAQLYANGDPVRAAGLVKPLVHDGEYWRLMTGTLLHGGLLHLALNGLAIWSLAPLVEAHSGRPMLPIVFVSSAVAGSVSSLYLIPEAPSVGASGGILGIVGFLFLLGYRRRHSLPQGFVGRMGVAILATGIFGIVGYALVDNAMHLGGLLTGMAIALVLPVEQAEASPRTWRIVATVGDLALATLVIAAAGAVAMLVVW